MACVLVTGGAGYIGSHTCVELLAAGHEVVVADNLCNAHEEVLQRVEALAGRRLRAFHRIDVRDAAALSAVFAEYPVNAVIHLAALKAVGESVREPLAYYDNNVVGALVLLRVMNAAGVRGIVFSSSATVYGAPAAMPVREEFPLAPTNPYGHGKAVVEQMLVDLHRADSRWSVMTLRYFNPVGAHPSGTIGEDPQGVPENLVPYVCQVATGRRDELRVFGDDYPTPDGTGVRDYLHVVDLAAAHVRAVERLAELGGVTCLNLGTGRGYSVLEVVNAFAEATGRPIPYRIEARRPGDIAECWADASRAEGVLGWRAQRGLTEMCADSWRWQSRNPNGYVSALKP